MKFVIDDTVFLKLPDVCFGVVMANNIVHKDSDLSTSELLQESVNEILLKYKNYDIKDIQTIKLLRDAFTKVNINPSKYFSSIEAIILRIIKYGKFPNINAIVDLSNHVSLKYLVPIGAHDADKSNGDYMVRFADENDQFLPFGSTDFENVDKGELIYASGNRVKTRRWIWRQSEEGKITNESSNVFFPIDGFNFIKDSVIKARDTLAFLLNQHFSCDIQTGFIDANKRLVIL